MFNDGLGKERAMDVKEDRFTNMVENTSLEGVTHFFVLRLGLFPAVALRPTQFREPFGQGKFSDFFVEFHDSCVRRCLGGQRS